MKGRSENRGGPPSADLLVCFPSRAHLTLMPKPISSPARQPSTLNRHRRTRSRAAATTNSSSSSSSSQARPTEIAAEPTSPKVTCAGQIKIITPKPKACKNWQSVMEEIERLHDRKQRKKSTWAESLGFKKDAYQFLTCLRRLRFDFRCFGSSSDPTTTTTTTDEEQEEDDDHDVNLKESSRTVFSKWFMVLQEEQNNIIQIKQESGGGGRGPCAPPPNALLLMRCRSAPAKNWLQEEKKEKEKEKSNSLEVLMKFDAEFYKLSSSSDINVGSTKDQLLFRSRTWKR